MQSLIENETWILGKLPKGRKFVKTHWIFKHDILGNKKFKVRLVAKGSSQEVVLEFDQTFTPLARYDSIRTTLAVSYASHLM